MINSIHIKRKITRKAGDNTRVITQVRNNSREFFFKNWCYAGLWAKRWHDSRNLQLLKIDKQLVHCSTKKNVSQLVQLQMAGIYIFQV